MSFGLTLLQITLTTPAALMMSAPFPVHQAQLSGPSGANRLIGGIISFAHWPDRAGERTDRSDRTLCVFGTPQLAVPVAPIVNGKPMTRIIHRTTNPPNALGCDILYLGKMGLPERAKLIQSLSGRSILTITDDDPNCSYGSMFCLYRQTNQVGFSVNLDALKRGNMRVDPRVLRIGREG